MSSDLPHLPLEIVLRIILYSDPDTLAVIARVSKACNDAAQRLLTCMVVTLDSEQLIRLLQDFIGDGTTPPSDEAAQHLKAIERLELIKHRFPGLPVDLVWEAAALASKCFFVHRAGEVWLEQ